MKTIKLNQHDYRELLSHLKNLGLGDSIEKYQNWCTANGFHKTLVKTSIQRRKEVEHFSRQSVLTKYAENKKALKGDFLGSLLNGEIEIKTKRQGENLVVDDSNFPNKFKPLARTFWLLQPEELAKTKKLADILRVKSDDEFLTHSLCRDNVIVLQTLAKIASYEDHWLRPLETWKPKSHNYKKQFSSVLRHLFVKYTMPLFMDSVWWDKSSYLLPDEKETTFRWYLHLGLGENLRKAENLPIPVTKKIAHLFMQAPDDYDCMQALRWGQVLSMGGNERLMRALLGTKIDNVAHEKFKNDDFWLTVIQWFIDNPMIDTTQIGPIVDYINNQKFVEQDVIRNGRRFLEPPEQPNFTMKGRSPETLYKLVEKWHNNLTKWKKSGYKKWVATGVTWIREEGQGRSYRRWEIHELLDSNELREEGKEMRHCVSSYSHSCASGRIAIWSMRCHTENGIVDRLTLEVNQADKQINQARGRLNALPNEKQKRILNVWAAVRGYSIGRYVMGIG